MRVEIARSDNPGATSVPYRTNAPAAIAGASSVSWRGLARADPTIDNKNGAYPRPQQERDGDERPQALPIKAAADGPDERCEDGEPPTRAQTQIRGIHLIHAGAISADCKSIVAFRAGAYAHVAVQQYAACMDISPFEPWPPVTRRQGVPPARVASAVTR